jgi:hypothetical protein
MSTEKKAVTVYLDAPLKVRIEVAAKDEGRSLSNLIERTLMHEFPITGEEFKLEPSPPPRRKPRHK